MRRVSILTGNNGLYVPQELARGADGIMTGFAFTGMLVEVFDLFEDGRTEEAEDLFDLYLPVLRHEAQFGFGLALRKEVLHRRGPSPRPGPAIRDPAWTPATTPSWTLCSTASGPNSLPPAVPSPPACSARVSAKRV